MDEKDYIMRMIKQLVRVILQIFGLVQKGSYEEAFDVIDMTLEKYTGLSSKLIGEFDEENLISFLSPGGNLNHERGFVIGVLLKEEGDILLKQNRIVEAFERYKKSYSLLSKVKETYYDVMPEINNIFDELKEKIEPKNRQG